MTMTRHYATVPLLCLLALAGPSPVLAGGATAQDRTGKSPFSMQAAIEQARRSPFHAAALPGIQATDPGEVPQPLSDLPIQVTDSREGAVSAGNIFFFSLPVAAVLDLVAMSDIGEAGLGLDPLISLGAVAGPALVARLTGARTVFAVVGSALGFLNGVFITKAFDKFGIFVAPAFHAGVMAALSILGDRTR